VNKTLFPGINSPRFKVTNKMENEKWIQVIAREGKIVFETIETGNTGDAKNG